jgi:hypothetical protein
MPGPLYGTPVDNVTAVATPSLTTGAADAAFPLTNIDDLDPGVVFKGTSGTITIRFTFGVAQLLAAIALINHNLHGMTLTVTNNAGMASQNLVVPAVPEDGLSKNPWLDLRAVSSTTATQWNIAISGAASNVAIGEIVLLSALRELNIRWDYSYKELHPAVQHRTEYGKRLQYGLGVRTRLFSGEALLYQDRNAIRTLRRAAKGTLLPWLFIPDEDENDALLAQFADGDDGSEEYQWVHPDLSGGIVDMPVAVEEVQSGLAL